MNFSYHSLQSLKAVVDSFLDLIYPKLCLHCYESVESQDGILCQECLKQLTLIDPIDRCPLCFSSDYCPETKKCFACLKQEPFFEGMAAAFDYIGPAASLVCRLKYADQPYLAKGASAFMAAQFLQLHWPFPDWIVPVPISFTHKLQRGYNQSLLLACGLSKILNVPVLEALKRKSGDFSQTGLNKEQRASLSGVNIQLKGDTPLADKSLLLIDDVMTTSTTLRLSAERLMEKGPSKIYALTFCRAV